MKKNIAVIFGGTNTEHEVSIASAKSIIQHLDTAKYQVHPVHITKANHWTYEEKNINPFDWFKQHIDLIFPVLHGPYGEDGTIQGMLDLLHLPYVGCNVLSSAVCMDKVIQKQLCREQGIPIAPFMFTTKHHWQIDPKTTLQLIGSKLGYPVFVKPANQGSSIGIVKVSQPDQINSAIDQALQYDTKVIIEQAVKPAREIESAILGNHQPEVSVLGEIIPSNEFYDYDAKYVDGKSKAVIPADLPPKITEKIQQLALKAFSLLNCTGLARIDFLINAKTLDIYLNELNTMPGFTTISMYPKLWQASGISYSQLLDQLISLALERSAEQAGKNLSYQPKLPWHQS